LPAVDVVVGFVGVVAPVGVVVAVVVEATLAEPPPELSPQPPSARRAHRHAATPASETGRATPPPPDPSRPPNLRPISILLPETI
jgi:hypothetical protein